MPFVLDASTTAVWAFKDEVSPYANLVLGQLEIDRAAVPTVWPLEVANALLIGERRGRIPPHETTAFLDGLAKLAIDVEGDHSPAWGATLALSRALGLTAYDASYLELAGRLGIPLATQDNRLRTAAVAIGVPILTPTAPPGPGTSNGSETT